MRSRSQWPTAWPPVASCLDELATDPRIGEHPRFYAVLAHLLEMAGDRDAARVRYLDAARRSTSIPQQRYLHARAARLE